MEQYACYSSDHDDKFGNILKQYVLAVSDVSDQYGPHTSISYTAVNIAGSPQNYPQHGDFINTFILTTFNNWEREVPSFHPEFGLRNISPSHAALVHDYLVVTFEIPVHPIRLEIYETFNPGAVYRIWAFTVGGNWRMLWDKITDEKETSCQQLQSRCFIPKIRNIGCRVRVVRLEFNTRDSIYFPGYDGILLIGPEVQLKGVPRADKEDSWAMAIRGSSTADQAEASTFTQLPYEILYTIFSNLDIPSLRMAEMVCKTFKDVASDPHLYREVNLRPYWMMVDSKMLTWLKSHCTTIRKLDLSWSGMYGYLKQMDIIGFLRECGSKIIDLRLDNIDIEFCEKSLNCIASYCPDLRNLSLKYARFSTMATNIGFKNLNRLNLSRTSVSTECLVQLLPNNPLLQHLNLSCCVEIDASVVVETLARHNRDLVSLILWKTSDLRSSAIRTLKACTKLRELDFGYCIAQERLNGALEEVLKNCPDLVKLYLSGFRIFCDADLAAIAEYCPHLVQLDLMGCMQVGSPLVERILNRCRKLRLVDLTYCPEIKEGTVKRWRASFKDVAIIYMCVRIDP